ncbi:hypothetical protein ACFVMC_24365 [Nocardia sp. NPDC127579]|uniref:hypothetical protein n=1 Tax=Nocardia sp. NPDC127579 TaxID=3345402 RepID=UPI0036280F6A
MAAEKPDRIEDRHTTVRLAYPRLGAMAILAVACFTACSPEGTTGSEENRPRFATTPSSCTQVARPIDGAIKSFAGSLYSSTVSIDDRGGVQQDIIHQHLSCSVSYFDRDGLPASRTQDQPKSRIVSLLILRSTTDKSVELAKNSFQKNFGEIANALKLPGIGDDAFIYDTEEPSVGTLRGTVRFRVSNVEIVVGATAGNSSQKLDTPSLKTEVRSTAEAMARTLADNLDSVMR